MLLKLTGAGSIVEPGLVPAGMKEDLLVKSVLLVPSGPVALATPTGPLSTPVIGVVATLIISWLSSPPGPVPVLLLFVSIPWVIGLATPSMIFASTAAAFVGRIAFVDAAPGVMLPAGPL